MTSEATIRLLPFRNGIDLPEDPLRWECREHPEAGVFNNIGSHLRVRHPQGAYVDTRLRFEEAPDDPRD